MSKPPPQIGESDSPFRGKGDDKNLLNPIAVSLGKCLNRFSKFNDVMPIISFLISFTAFIILIKKNPRRRGFPLNLGSLICLSAAIFSLERTLLVLLESFLEDDVGRGPICWIIGFVSQVGQTSLLYWWMCSTIVLYQVIFKKVPVNTIRSQKQYYYSTVISIMLVLFLIQQIISQYYYYSRAKTCTIGNLELKWGIIYIHAVLGVLLFLFLGIPVVRVLLRRRDADLIDPERASLLREEGVLQVILGFLIFMTAASNLLRGIFSLLYTRLESPSENAFARAIAYPSCVLFQVLPGTLGTLIGLAYVSNKTTFKWLQQKSRSCCRKHQSTKETLECDGDLNSGSVTFKAMKTPDKNSLSAPRTNCYEEYISISFRDNGISDSTQSMIDLSD